MVKTNTKNGISPTKMLLALGVISACAAMVAAPATFAEGEADEQQRFTQCLIDSYNYENQTELTSLTDAQMAVIKDVNCSSFSKINIHSLDKLTGLENLSVYKASNTSIDLSSNSELERLSIYSEDTTSIAFPTTNSKLYDVDITTKIKDLDLSGVSSLQRIVVSGSETVTLPEGNTLTSIHIVENIKSLDLSKNPKLEYLTITGGDIDSLNLSANTELRILSIWNTKMSGVDLSHNPKLESVNLHNNKISELDLSKNQNLVDVDIAEDGISKIDISKNNAIYYLSVAGDKIKELDVSKNTELVSLDISGSKIKELDISKNSKLKYLYANHREESAAGELETIIMGKDGPKLVDAILFNNKLEYLDFSKADEENFSADLSGNKKLKIVAVPESWKNKYTEAQVRERLGLTDEQKDVIIQYGALKVPKTGFGEVATETVKYAAILALPTIIIVSFISKNFIKAKSKKVKFNR